MNQEPTIFERIISGEIPSHKVFEDTDHIAILTIEPLALGHTLVIPKHPYRNILTMPEDATAKLFACVGKVAKAVKTALSADGITMSMNNEPAGGQEVFHAHVHVIPRYENDGIMPPLPHLSYSGTEAADIAERLRNAASTL